MSSLVSRTLACMMKTDTIALLVYPGVMALDAVGPAEVFTTANQIMNQKRYRVVTWGVGSGPYRTESGLLMGADRELPVRPRAHTLIIPGGEGIRESEVLVALGSWLKRHEARFERIVTVCTGAYALAASGLADGLAVTTHWAHALDLQQQFPGVQVECGRVVHAVRKVCTRRGVSLPASTWPWN